jgi:hypothetical protein
VKISRRVLIAGAVCIAPTVTPACVIDEPLLAQHPSVKTLASRLAAMERAARDLRDMLHNVPAIGAAVPEDDIGSLSGWYAAEMERASGELSENAQAIQTLVAELLAPA